MNSHTDRDGGARTGFLGVQRRSAFRWAAAGVVVLVAGAVALVGRKPAAGDALARARRTGVLRIGYAIEAPYAFLGQGGRVTGESPEIARLVAEQLGIARVEWHLAEFDTLIDELEAGRFDVIAAGMFRTPERERRVSFSRPTFRVHGALLAPCGNPLGLRGVAGLQTNPVVRVAVLSGSVEQAGLARLGVPAARVVAAPDARTGRELVRSGQADCLLLSAPTIRWMAHEDPADGAVVVELADGDEVEGTGAGAFQFRRGDVALRDAWDRVLAAYIGGAAHRQLVQPFGFAAGELPGPEGVAAPPEPR